MTTKRPSAETEGYADPEMLRNFLEEQDEETANLHALFQSTSAANRALEAVVQTILHEIDPGGTLRHIIADDLEERSVAEQRMVENMGREYDVEICAFGTLATRIRTPPR